MGFLEDTDWASLTHAYGRATDTPAHLRALLDGDEGARKAALEHLWSAIIHQGTPWLATPKVARFVAEHLADPRVEPIRDTLLAFLASVVAAALREVDHRPQLERDAQYPIDALLAAADEEKMYEDERAANSLYARSVLGCMGVLDSLVESTFAALASDAPRVRVRAAQTASYLAKAGASIDRTALSGRLRTLASAADVDERAAYMGSLGMLGEAPREFLDDPAPAVRACAALAPALAEDASAIDVLAHALEHEDIDNWFADRPPQFSMWPRFSIVIALTKRVHDFDRLVDAAVHVARTTRLRRVDYEWGPLLRAAFGATRGRVPTAAARRYLAALVENDDLWDPIYGNAKRVFDDLGLPYDRDACRALVA